MQADLVYRATDEQPEQIRELATRHAQTQADQAYSALPERPARVNALLDDNRDDTDIATRLNAEGWLRATGAFDAPSVRRIRIRWELTSVKERLRASGKLTTPDIAVRLGIGIKTVYNWVRAGRIRGHRVGRQAIWIFDAIEDQPEPIRQRVASRATVGQRRPGLLSDAAAGPGAL